MFKLIGTLFLIFIITLGLIFIVLDILDIAEDFRLELPIATFNTILISALAVPVVICSARVFMKSGSPAAFGLDGAALAFGFSIILYGWLTNTDLNTRITAYDTGVFLAAVLHSLGAGYLFFLRRNLTGRPTTRIIVLSVVSLVLLLVICLITWLAHQNIITFIPRSIGAGFSVRDVVQGIAFILCFGAAAVYMSEYLKAKEDSSFWYSLGLVLFAAGVIFISRGPLESRIAWLGRLSEYTGGIYMLLAAFSFNQRTGE